MYRRGAFTLIELLVVMAVIAILVTLAIPSYQVHRKNAEKVVCMSQMRVIHVALDNYMLDKHQWPQIPGSIFEGDEETDFWKWWILTLETYGAGENMWVCPSDKIQRESKMDYNGSYMPAKFDAHNSTPYRWAKQPWLIERGKLHKQGAHIMFPDGSIRNSNEVF